VHVTEFDAKALAWDDAAKVARAVAVAEAIGEQVPLAEIPDLFEFGCWTGLPSLALHHVHDVPALLARLRRLLRPGGWVALSDLDDDEGQFHDAHTHRHHNGYDRATLTRWLTDVAFSTPPILAKVVDGVERDFPLFLAVGRMAPS
jgi:SAM-dependent methyltransferase